MRLLIAAFLTAHGLIHLLGFAKAFRLAELPQLIVPVSPAMGVLWLTAAILFIAAAAMVFVSAEWWSIVGLAAIILSTIAIVPSWGDAKAGALANVIALSFVAGGFVVQGPTSLRAHYEHDVARGLAHSAPDVQLSEADLAALPDPVKRYLRRAGVVGQPRVRNVRARMHGRFRGAAEGDWMPFEAEQHNFFDGRFYDGRSRYFYMTATRSHVPMQGFQRYVGADASMHIKVAGLVTVVYVDGPDMTHAETVTLFNDMCVLAPATLIDPTIVWTPVDAHTVDAQFTNAGATIRAQLRFNDDGDLVDFWSDDRSRASEDGKTLTRARWSTPARTFRTFGAVRLLGSGDARWHDPDGTWPYIELEIDAVDYNLAR